MKLRLFVNPNPPPAKPERMPSLNDPFAGNGALSFAALQRCNLILDNVQAAWNAETHILEKVMMIKWRNDVASALKELEDRLREETAKAPGDPRSL